MKYKVHTLSGALLDMCVAKALGVKDVLIEDNTCYAIKKRIIDPVTHQSVPAKKLVYSPTNCCETFVSVLKALHISTDYVGNGKWYACMFLSNHHSGSAFIGLYGDSLEESVFRVYCFYTFGNDVDL